MSGMRGDKARFDRERKKNSLRRRRSRELRKKLRGTNTESGLRKTTNPTPPAQSSRKTERF